ncbi:hypothetical protein [Nitrococcus mobilis]|uniref:Uncharacterized protein n=1 Tax=Nitrococcus mobilis Nb-231 TaxID=314278 RepID=A4BUC0_9GAMM|nr:hypothetical protein [Nitrococcus mobilis]EAR20634.1 hypothetical protein NB231_01918 [Nitrococcus mobilis Nb-231]
MLELSVGVVLMLAAALVGLFLGTRRSSKTKVTAKNGSVGVGGDANGPIIVTHTRGPAGVQPGWERGLMIVAAVVGMLGFLLTVRSLLS